MLRSTFYDSQKWLESKKVDAILGLRENNGHIAPYLFTETCELKSLVISSYSSEVIPRYFASGKSQRHKKKIIAFLNRSIPMPSSVFARGCDEKALIELAKRKQLKYRLVHYCRSQERRQKYNQNVAWKCGTKS